MVINEFKKNYLFTTRFNLADPLGKETDDYVELRELNMQESKELQAVNQDDTKIMIEKIEQYFVPCLIASSFVNEDGTKCTAKQVYDAMKDSGTLFTDVLTKWVQSLPFQHRLRKNGK